MKDIQDLEKLKEEMKDQDQLVEFNKQRTTWLKDRWQALEDEQPRDSTPAMLEIEDRLAGVVREIKEDIFEFKPVVKEVSFNPPICISDFNMIYFRLRRQKYKRN